MTTAPIALFAYKRPELTLRTLEALSQCHLASESTLHVFCDGPKANKDKPAVEDVRGIVRRRRWCGRIEIVERGENLGLSASIISGVTDLCQKFGRVIVLEDDLIVAPFFLEYMNYSLEKYAQNAKVMQIAGHMFPCGLQPEDGAVFLPLTTTWGWATWERAWKYFDRAATGHAKLKVDSGLRDRFDLWGAYPYFGMLESQLEGKIDSWGIRWYLSVYLRGGLVLFPRVSLVKNLGSDGRGTHTGKKSAVAKLFSADVPMARHIGQFPDVAIDERAFERVVAFLRQESRGSTLARLRRKLSALLH